MKIKKITFQMSRDYNAIMECEHCGHEQEDKNGYNDGYYHNHVIPAMKCKECGKSSNDCANFTHSPDCTGGCPAELEE